MPKKPLTTITPREGLSRRLDVNALISASAEIIDREGIGALTLTVLARALGVKPPSLYAHMHSLDDLQQKVAVFGLQELERAILQAGFGKSGENAVRSLCFAYRDFAHSRPGVYAASYLWLKPDTAEVRETTKRFGEVVMQIMEPLFVGLSRADRVHRLRIIRVALHGMVGLEQAHAFWEPVEVDKTFEHMLDMLIDMATARRPPKRRLPDGLKTVV